MNFLQNILGNLIRVVYEFLNNVMATEPESISFLAIAIIITTFIFKTLLIPLTLSQIKTQKVTAIIGPKQQEIQRKYKNNPEMMQQKLKELYAEHKHNPMGGCLLLLIQFPIIIAFFRVMQNPELYIFGATGVTDFAKNFFWIQDLTKPDPLIYGLPLINAVTQFLYAKMTMSNQPKPDPKGDPQMAQMQSMNSMMLYGMPLMMFFVARSLSAGLILYWAVGNVIEMFYRFIIRKAMGRDEGGTANEIRN